MASDTADPFVFANLHLFLNQKHTHHHHHHHSQHSTQILHDRISKLFPSVANNSSTAAGVSSSRRHHSRRSSSGGKISKSKSRSKAALQYLKPGALAQMRDAQRTSRIPSTTSCCARKKRHSEEDLDDVSSALRDTPSVSEGHVPPSLSDMTPTPVVRVFGPLCPQRKKLLAPKAPFVDQTAPDTNSADNVDVASSSPASQFGEESMLESLPLELLVRIVCNLRHDQLKPAFHVSRRLRQAVVIARQCHFDYTTPDRERHDFVQITPPRANRVCEVGPSRPPTPRAPRHAQRPVQARISVADMQQLAVPLFQEPATGADQLRQQPASRATFRGVASHRVLFNEEELCEAVAQNTL